MFINGVQVQQYVSPQDIKGTPNGYSPDPELFTNMEIGIIDDNSSMLDRLTLRVPTSALTNGKRLENRRGTRLTHFLNVIRAFADRQYNLRDNEQVVFIRFLT
ncbi:MAG: hypothetical protein ACXAEN_24345 [Candidatus Thorarchaeota archaeon]|jgi:hypothetical protein